MRLEGVVHGTSHPEALIKFVARVSLPFGQDSDSKYGFE
jgi:hypothetical protein